MWNLALDFKNHEHVIEQQKSKKYNANDRKIKTRNTIVKMIATFLLTLWVNKYILIKYIAITFVLLSKVYIIGIVYLKSKFVYCPRWLWSGFTFLKKNIICATNQITNENVVSAIKNLNSDYILNRAGQNHKINKSFL